MARELCLSISPLREYPPELDCRWKEGRNKPFARNGEGFVTGFKISLPRIEKFAMFGDGCGACPF